ncbi:MAG: D-alanine--D-alanine ligase family protein [Bacillota bacterium]|nr:D-alanine--D-alanine ligase family protein [Bacillota bacterium]
MKIKLAVLFGGKSVEHEISIISAVQAILSIDTEKYDVIPIYITKENEMYVGSGLTNIENYKDINLLLDKSQRVNILNEKNRIKIMKYPMRAFKNNVYDTIDVAFPIVHGTNVEDGTLQGFLHMMNLPYVGCDVLSSAVGMDKSVMKSVLKDNGIPVLPCVCVRSHEFAQRPDEQISKIEEAIPYPVIVKPVNLGSSIGIKKANDRSGLIEAMELGFEFAPQVLVESAIVNLKEINCSVLGDCETAEASECEEPINTDEILSYEDKYIGGGKTKGTDGAKGMSGAKRKLPADISSEMREEIRTLAVKTFQALGCNGVARIDFMIDNDNGKLYVNEINTIPGSLSFYLWEPMGVSYTELLDRMIKLALKRKRETENIHYSFKTNVLSGVKLGGGKASKL